MSLIAAHWIMCSAVNDQPGQRPLDDSAARVHGDATLLSWLADDLQGHLQRGAEQASRQPTAPPRTYRNFSRWGDPSRQKCRAHRVGAGRLR